MAYLPEQGDIVFLEFESQAGQEQKGRRPAFVVSNNTFNKFTKMAIVCPITNTDRGYPLHKVDRGTGLLSPLEVTTTPSPCQL